MYKPGGTIADALNRIQANEYVLPAIQREFVWRPEQIERLFDSFMQGYPFGTFLFWRVAAETSAKFKFYGFVRDYHQRDAAHCPELGIFHHKSVTAVLDGQQRLTALNIGLRGSMAVKQPNKWWTSDDAFPRRVLCLDLLAPHDADENGVFYRFRFMTEAQEAAAQDALWFKVPDVLGMKSGPAMLTTLVAKGLQGDQLTRAYETLDHLHRIVHTSNIVNYYEEEAQNLDRVLNIFIRLNSGGTVLSYSDLLLSIAVAQWKQVDARAEIHNLVGELNRIGTGFSFSQDFVLKAGLMLAGIASVGFKVENFTAANMAALEANWPGIRLALIRTVELAASFGLDGQTLRADSALLPVAYYLFRREAPVNYVTHSQYASDREAIQFWLIPSLLKASGIWGSGLDVLLTALRSIIQKEGVKSFPSTAISREMARRGKSIDFEPAEIEDLVYLEYGDKRTFLLLTLLFPFVDLKNKFHIDHVFPASKFTKRRLLKSGITESKIDDYMDRMNQLPNLQLLEGAINIEKRATLPASWLEKYYSDEKKRRHYREIHDLGEIPSDIVDFKIFYNNRRKQLKKRIEDLLSN